jgi:hypothetical protein
MPKVKPSKRHIRSYRYEIPVPAPRVQTPPYRRTAEIYGHDQTHRLGAVQGVRLEYGQGDLKKWGATTDLARVELKTSLVRDAGYGMFAAENIQAGRLFAQYYGKIISCLEAEKLKREVLPFHS